MKNLGKYELAAVKRTAASVRMMESKKARLLVKKAKIDEELEDVEKTIEAFEQPIKVMSGGFTSTEILATIAETVSGEGVKEGEGNLVDDAPVGEVEVPAEEAVAIDPTVQSPIAENPFAGGIAPGISY